MSFRLSVLDQSPIAEGLTSGDALRNSIDLAQLAESLGALRYWVAEHHGTTMLAGTSPEVLIGAIAGATTTLRVGSGGVMLPHYSALKVAEVFRLLSALYPKRIDLAVGRAAGTDPMTAYALQRDRRHAGPDDFPEQLAELLAYVRDGFSPGHRFSRLIAAFSDPTVENPDAWLLGSSPQSGVWAAELGLPYAFADFIFPGGAAIARRYRETFVPCARRQKPYVIVAAWALCAETSAEAERLAASSRMAFAHFLSGQPIRIPPVDVAVEFLARNPEALDALIQRRRAIIGTPAAVRTGLEELARDYEADEVMVVTITYDHQARRRSYELLARELTRS